MDFKKAAIGTASRILRFIGIIAVIYVSMVFYLALTERRNAFPRAITHVEARQAIDGKASPISCTMEDGTVLGGWTLGAQGSPTLLYYPDADEDAAQFLAEVQELPGVTLVTFNYRGSTENKGTPSQETFEPDARGIMECASQVNGTPKFIAGRGTGAILAAEQMSAATTANTKLILIDPVLSIADAISEKYRLFYPKFLVRADVKMPREILEQTQNRAFLFLDRKMHSERNHTLGSQNPSLKQVDRSEKTLSETLSVVTNEEN